MGRRRLEWVRRPPGSRTYHYDFTLTWGIKPRQQRRRFRGSCGTTIKADAVAYARRLRKKLYDQYVLGIGEVPPPGLTPMTIDQAAARYWTEVVEPRYFAPIPGEAPHRTKARERQAANRRAHLRTLLRIIGKATSMRDVTTDVAIKFVTTRRQEKARHSDRYISGNTLEAEINMLATLVDRARKRWKEPGVGEIDGREVGTYIPRARKRKVRLSKQQARQGLEGTVAHGGPILRFAMTTAMRRENVTFLQWEELDLDQAVARVRVKGGKDLEVVLIPETVRMLRALQPDPALRAGHVWRYGQMGCQCAICTGAKGRERRPILSLAGIMKEFAAAAGEPGLTLHGLRHTASSWLQDHTGNLTYSKEMLGHEDERTTGDYTHVVSDDLRAAATVALSLEGAPNKPQIRHGGGKGRKRGRQSHA